MGLLDKAKAAAEQATTIAKEGAQELQTKRDLSTAYSDLGKATFELADKGELTHPELTEQVDRIRSLRESLAGGDAQDQPAEAAAPTT